VRGEVKVVQDAHLIVIDNIPDPIASEDQEEIIIRDLVLGNLGLS
jgi:hypothetical protein